MKPVMQTRFGYPEGDCLMACIASILEVRLDSCPDLYTEAHLKKKHWFNIVRAFCLGHGFLAVHYDQGGKDRIIPEGYHVGQGPSPRDLVDEDGQPVGHSIVTLDGEMVHDPHPDGSGLAGEFDGWVILVRLTDCWVVEQEG